MTFNEAMKAMLMGKKVKRVDIPGYIMLNSKGDVVNNAGESASFNKNDLVNLDWAIAIFKKPRDGALLKRYGRYYRLTKDSDGTYKIREVATHIVDIKGITEKYLVKDLMFYNFEFIEN